MKKLIIFLILLLCVSNADAEILFQDGFEYTVDKDTVDKGAFIANYGETGSLTTTDGGPWRVWKSLPYNTGARGYTYTVTSIPGFSGVFPGTVPSGRVLKSEHLPIPGYQSDTYVALYSLSPAPVTVPANAWIQYWIYFQYYGDELSVFSNGKMIYPCSDSGTGPCATQHTDWLTQWQWDYSGEPFELRTTEPGHVYIHLETQGTAQQEGVGETTGNLGPNQSEATARFNPNTWYLFKFHHDFRTNNPTAQFWFKAQGDTNWSTYWEYIDGVTPGLTWTPYSNGGSYRFTFLEMNDDYRCWFYVDDLVVATTESDLPTYGGSDTTAPTVTAFTITPTSYTGWVLPIATFTATDAVGVTGYCVNESATAPTSGSCSGSGWSATAQTNYTFTTAGAKTLYAWAKDAAGNISTSLNDTVTIFEPTSSGVTIPGGVRIQ